MRDHQRGAMPRDRAQRRLDVLLGACIQRTGRLVQDQNARFDELTDKALVLTEQAERQPLYEEASRILVEDAAGLFIYNTRWFGPFSKNVRDVRFCPIGDAQDIRWMSMT